MTTKEYNATFPTEPKHSSHTHLLCWKSVLAGLLISIMAYMIFAAIGLGGIGSIAENAIEQERNGSALATGAGLWVGLSAVMSLFLGSYFAVRMAKSVTNKMGAAHGFVVASLFFILLMLGAGTTIGGLSQGFGHLVAGLGQGAVNVSAQPAVQDTINRAIASGNLKSDPKVVAEGLSLRLLQGDVESAKAYYAYQTGLTATEVDAKVAQMKTEFDQAVKVTGEKAARAVADIGWSLLVTFLVGLIGAVAGGRIGAHANTSRPLVENEEVFVVGRSPVLANQHGSIAPYLFAWLLGVPTSILFLVLILRTIF